jgi:hypothetical protein
LSAERPVRSWVRRPRRGQVTIWRKAAVTIDIRRDSTSLSIPAAAIEPDLAAARQGHAMKPAARPRDWRRIHHSPAFWIGVVLCLTAIAIYVMSDDLAWRPASSPG